MYCDAYFKSDVAILSISSYVWFSPHIPQIKV